MERAEGIEAVDADVVRAGTETNGGGEDEDKDEADAEAKVADEEDVDDEDADVETRAIERTAEGGEAKKGNLVGERAG